LPWLLRGGVAAASTLLRRPASHSLTVVNGRRRALVSTLARPQGGPGLIFFGLRRASVRHSSLDCTRRTLARLDIIAALTLLRGLRHPKQLALHHWQVAESWILEAPPSVRPLRSTNSLKVTPSRSAMRYSDPLCRGNGIASSLGLPCDWIVHVFMKPSNESDLGPRVGAHSKHCSNKANMRTVSCAAHRPIIDLALG
jgi:hypothetical protein